MMMMAIAYFFTSMIFCSAPEAIISSPISSDFDDAGAGYWTHFILIDFNSIIRDAISDCDYMPGMPCRHRGCLRHVSHPCEGCGRVNGEGPAFIDTNTPYK